MCDLCRELDFQIERCREIKSSALNELMREAAISLIISYEEDKVRLHEERNEKGDARRTI
jgi:hypothetical protein